MRAARNNSPSTVPLTDAMALISASFQLIVKLPTAALSLFKVTYAVTRLLVWSQDTVPDTATSCVNRTDLRWKA